jgi:hypothetical protein
MQTFGREIEQRCARAGVVAEIDILEPGDLLRFAACAESEIGGGEPRDRMAVAVRDRGIEGELPALRGRLRIAGARSLAENDWREKEQNRETAFHFPTV